jgi:membrane-bound lytic murein transglycosylase B
MKAPFAIAAILAAALAGCAATPNTQLADAGCKIEPGMTANTVNKRAQASDLDRKWAEAQLRSSNYYRQALARDENSNVVQAAKDCQ